MKTIEGTNKTLGAMSAAKSRISRGYLLLLTGISPVPPNHLVPRSIIRNFSAA